MADEMVLKAQRFINSYAVDGIPDVEENGRTSWTVMYALTRVLQHELGLSTLTDSFGPATLAALRSRFPVIDVHTRHEAVYRVVQSALYCKGYDGGELEGTYNPRVAASVTRVKQNMGVSAVYPGDGVTPKVFKALLTMDAYTVVSGGTDQIRTIQQWLNGRYVGRQNFFIIPCDGNFSRDVQKALIYAIQFEMGMGDETATGAFGPATRDGLRNNSVGPGSAGTWVSLFTAAMIFNRRAGVPFTDRFDARIGDSVRQFQNFVKLPANGRGDFPTWASLLVSTGDYERKGTACDCVTEVTAARAQALRNAGYRIVGRYLANYAGSTLNKQIRPDELQVTAANGLRTFPIYQTNGGEASYFSRSAGIADALHAVERARHYGYKAGTRIYFAVDFDALDHQVTERILPHFRAIRDTMSEHGPEYEVGIYGPRNVCSRVRAAGFTSASFVSGMSTGFSGNLGYPLPDDWAFDQISTIKVGSGSGHIEIDNNIVSGRDNGQDSYGMGQFSDGLDVSFDKAQRNAMLADVQSYFVNVMKVPEEGGSGGLAFSVRTTTECFDILMDYDWLLTRLARNLRVRKALIQCPLMWELRAMNTADGLADELVIDHYKGGASTKNDSSTGPGQIFAKTAIRARNHAIREGVIAGTIMDATKESDLWAVWQRLREDTVYNMTTVPLVLIEGAHEIGAARPGLDTDEEDSRRTLARYNGTDQSAQGYGTALLGLYRVFEKYHAPLRDR
ncbi:glycoside hydrolase domain-containing protein [Streptomyces sp. NPDC029674]|uniref:glycoside hydrolase domain-containing protein n=1 Tax=Streptomyces sp. NPDC029674 TaxID=3365297 RepID=UPI00384BF022